MTLAQFPEFGFFVQNSRIGIISELFWSVMIRRPRLTFAENRTEIVAPKIKNVYFQLNDRIISISKDQILRWKFHRETVTVKGPKLWMWTI